MLKAYVKKDELCLNFGHFKEFILKLAMSK